MKRSSFNAFVLSICTIIYVLMGSSLSAQSVRITNKGQIIPLNTGNSIFIGLNAGNADDLTDNRNVFIGHSAGQFSTSAVNLTAVGSFALQDNTSGNFNTAFGYLALRRNTSGGQNTGIGPFALNSNISGYNNVAVGISSLDQNTSGSNNTAVGAFSLRDNLGENNTAVGMYALYTNTTSDNNVALGFNCLREGNGQQNTGVGTEALRKSRGSNNTAIGYFSGQNDSLSSSNVYIGYAAGYHSSVVTNKNNNVLVGFRAGQFITGNGNVCLGYEAGRNETGANKLYIDNSSTSTPLIYGDFASNELAFNGKVTLNTAQGLTAFVWDEGKGVLKNSPDAILWDRPVFRMLLDADNNNGGTSGEAKFQLYSNVDTSGTQTAKVNLNLDGGDSWISVGNLGLGITEPAHKLEVAGCVSASSGLSGAHVALKAQSAEAVWFNGTQFSWGFGGTWNRFADSVRIGGNTSPSHLLQVDGVARSTQSTWATSSDRRVKKDIATLEKGLHTLMQFRPVTFAWNEEYHTAHPALKDHNYGFIAQEVEDIIPSMVNTVKEEFGHEIITDFKVLSTDALIPILVRAVQEQQHMIESLQKELAEIKGLTNHE